MRIENEERLRNSKTVEQFLNTFLDLSAKEKRSILGTEVMVPQSTIFYRVRSCSSFAAGQNPQDPAQWTPPPQQKRERFNKEGENVLYVAKDPFVLGREVNLSEGEEFYLAKYICKKPFNVGSLVCQNSFAGFVIHKIAMAIHGTDSLTEAEQNLLKKYRGNVKEREFLDIACDMMSHFYLHELIPDLYDITNNLAQIVLLQKPCGIRYASAYSPFEVSGAEQIITFNGLDDGNYALTEMGYKNIEFIYAEKKINKHFDMSEIIKQFGEASKTDRK